MATIPKYAYIRNKIVKLMQQILLAEDLKVSRIIHGHWRLAEWNLSNQELAGHIQRVFDLGITTFDHADIYGNYSCEQLFGDALKHKKELRHKIQIITKCGIKLLSDKYPERKVKHYDYGYDHIIYSVNNSLKKIGTDYIDLLLLHRPAPFFNPEEVAKAFSELKKSGKVLHFGVSNFSPQQFEMLNSYLDDKLVTNQVEISPYCLEDFENGNMDFFLKERIKPLAWSPLAGGKLLKQVDEKSKRLHKVLLEVSKELTIDSIDKTIYSWILKHPAVILPIVGSGKIERIKNAVEALHVNMPLELWYKIYNTSTGNELP